MPKVRQRQNLNHGDVPYSDANDLNHDKGFSDSEDINLVMARTRPGHLTNLVRQFFKDRSALRS